MKINIDFEEIKKEMESFISDPFDKAQYYTEELGFHILKFTQGLVEDLDFKLTVILEEQLQKREDVDIFTPHEPEPTLPDTDIFEPKEPNL